MEGGIQNSKGFHDGYEAFLLRKDNVFVASQQ